MIYAPIKNVKTFSYAHAHTHRERTAPSSVNFLMILFTFLPHVKRRAPSDCKMCSFQVKFFLSRSILVLSHSGTILSVYFCMFKDFLSKKMVKISICIKEKKKKTKQKWKRKKIGWNFFKARAFLLFSVADEYFCLVVGFSSVVEFEAFSFMSWGRGICFAQIFVWREKLAGSGWSVKKIFELNGKLVKQTL